MKTEKIVLETSLYRLRKSNACKDRYDHLVSKLGPEWGDKAPINLLDILAHNGTADCLWALHAVTKHPHGEMVMRLMAVEFAAAVLPIYEDKYPGDYRPRNALQAAWEYAHGEITSAELAAAWDAAARAAAEAVAKAVAGAAAWDAAARAAAEAAWAVAAEAAAWAAAAGAAAGDAGAARDAQMEIIRKYLGR